MTTLVIDPTPEYLTHWAKRGADGAANIETAKFMLRLRHYDNVIVNARWLGQVRALIEAGAHGLVIVSSLPSTSEQIEAYRAGAVDYRVKSFN